MKRLPATYLIALAVLVILGVVALLAYLGVPPFDNTQLFILFNSAGLIGLLILGVVGGAFVGMLLAHRMLGNREFTPFEKTVIQGLEDVRQRLERLERESKR